MKMHIATGTLIVLCAAACTTPPEQAAPLLIPDSDKGYTTHAINYTDTAGQRVLATAYLPLGKERSPVVIDLHGCDGVYEPRSRRWRGAFMENDIGLVVLDSFTPRNITQICEDLPKVSPMERAFDVAALLRHAGSHPMLRGRPLFLMGMSHGATTVLMMHQFGNAMFQSLQGMIAYYPWCLERLPYLNTDLLVMIGDADDWTPARRCRTMQVERQGRDYELVVYPNATHSFDIVGLDTRYLGHRLKHDPSAARDSMSRVLQFIKARTPGH